MFSPHADQQQQRTVVDTRESDSQIPSPQTKGFVSRKDEVGVLFKCFDCGFQPFQMSFDQHTKGHEDNKTKDTTRSTSAFDWASAGNTRPVTVAGAGDERDLTNRSQTGISIPMHQDHILFTTQRQVQALPPEPAMSAPTLQRKGEGKIGNAEMYLASRHHWPTLPCAPRPPIVLSVFRADAWEASQVMSPAFEDWSLDVVSPAHSHNYSVYTQQGAASYYEEFAAGSSFVLPANPNPSVASVVAGASVISGLATTQDVTHDHAVLGSFGGLQQVQTDPSQEEKGRQDRMKTELTEKTHAQGAEHGQHEECSKQQQVVSQAESESGVTGSMATEGAAAVEEDSIGQLVGASHKHVMSRQTNVECQTADGANDADEKEPKSNEKETSAALIQTECCNLATLELDPVCMTGSSLTTTALARPTAEDPQGTLKIGNAVLQATEFTDALQAAREDEVRRMQQREEKLITTLKKRGYSGFHPEDLALTILPSQQSQAL